MCPLRKQLMQAPVCFTQSKRILADMMIQFDIALMNVFAFFLPSSLQSRCVTFEFSQFEQVSKY